MAQDSGDTVVGWETASDSDTITMNGTTKGGIKGDFTPDHHFGFEAAAWYWHFVDVVWLFLFTFVYIWGSGSNY